MQEFFKRYKYKTVFEEEIDLDNFKTVFFEKAPFFLKSSNFVKMFKESFNIYEFEKLLWYAHKIDFSKIQISSNSTKVLAQHIDSSDILRLASDYLADNNCIVVNFAENFSPDLSLLVREIGETFNCTAYCSVFLNPPNSNCFNVHYDGIDVIAIQIEGSKLWQVGMPIIDLPTRNQTYELENENQLSLSYDLQEESLLYVPRGFIHNVVSTDKYSLHISIGLHSNRRADIYKEILRSVELDNVYVRSTPQGVLKKGFEFIENDFNLHENLLTDFIDPYAVKQALSRINAQKYSKLRLLPDGHLFGSLTTTDLLIDSIVSIRNGMPTEVVILNNDKVIFVFPCGFALEDEWLYKSLTLPILALPSVEYIRDIKDNFRIKDVPGMISDDSKLMLIKQLSRFGLIKKLS